MKKVLFRGPQLKAPKPQPKAESLHAIQDPIEKYVASVLKTELVRYGECGREVGGLGSIQTTYGGQTFHGTGTEWRRFGSPTNESVVPDPRNAEIKSANADGLVSFYQNTFTDEQTRSRFVTALLERLSRETEYAPIGYFFLLVLFRLGHLSDVLAKAKRDLQGDDGLGFSDLLHLLDGLLRFNHHLFTPESLDEVERFVEGLQESTFRIRERIAAIRTLALIPRPAVRITSRKRDEPT